MHLRVSARFHGNHYTQANKEHRAQPSYGTTPDRPKESRVEECKGFGPPKESRPRWLPVGRHIGGPDLKKVHRNARGHRKRYVTHSIMQVTRCKIGAFKPRATWQEAGRRSSCENNRMPRGVGGDRGSCCCSTARSAGGRCACRR